MKTRYFYIYKITHIPTGKAYYGRKTCIEKSFENYWGSSSHPLFFSKSSIGKNYFAQKDLTKNDLIENNLENYRREILVKVDNKKLTNTQKCNLEEKYIRENDCVNKSVNGKFCGGQEAWNKGKTLSDNHKQKLKDAQLNSENHTTRGKKLSKEHKKAISISNTGKVRTPEMRKRIGDAGRGRKQSQEEKDKRAESLRGQKRTPGQRKKMSESVKNSKTHNSKLKATCPNCGYHSTSLWVARKCGIKGEKCINEA